MAEKRSSGGLGQISVRDGQEPLEEIRLHLQEDPEGVREENQRETSHVTNRKKKKKKKERKKSRRHSQRHSRRKKHRRKKRYYSSDSSSSSSSSSSSDDSSISSSSSLESVKVSKHSKSTKSGSDKIRCPKPRIGNYTSKSKTEVWVGGSNLKPRTKPMNTLARRPTKFTAAEQIQQKCQAGLAAQYRLGSATEDNDVVFTDWIVQLKMDLEDRGLDTAM